VETSSERVGVWLIGARGSVATTAMVGARLVAHGLATADGMVTSGRDFAGTGLPPVADLVFGGHDVAEIPLVKRADALAGERVVPAHGLAAIGDDLEAIDRRIRPGIDVSDRAAGATTSLDRVRADLERFRAEEQLDHLVVVNVSSVEAAPAPHPAHTDLVALEAALAAGDCPLPNSGIYALAAFLVDAAFVDFTPSTATRLPALGALAVREGRCYAGRDGKTGETLLRSVLAPMFAQRGLTVRSWAGTNLLGGGDGRSLAEPERSAGKMATKGGILAETLGYPVDAPLHIDFVADMGEWKTAWDHVSFTGFLGTAMAMQFTWQGCDSALAAPLVLDLCRLTTLALRRGVRGPIEDLGFFFKDPLGTPEHALTRQYDRLVAWAAPARA
jgi:myo-inositol-1-phosphate synthase